MFYASHRYMWLLVAAVAGFGCAFALIRFVHALMPSEEQRLSINMLRHSREYLQQVKAEHKDALLQAEGTESLQRREESEWEVSSDSDVDYGDYTSAGEDDEGMLVTCTRGVEG